MQNKINEKYNKVELPGSFQGLSGFLKNNQINKKDTINALLSNKVFTLHNPIKRIFKRRRVLVSGIDDTWQADLVDMSNVAKHNYNYKYILTCIDVFSKYGWAVKIKKKNALEVLNAFKIILKDGRIPLKLHVDGGNEFKGVVKEYFEKLGVSLYITNSKLKASIVERFNRTLKSKMFRFFTYRKNLNKQRNKFLDYIHYLDKIVFSYNNSYHRSIKEKPINVTKKNEDKIFFNLYDFNKNEGDDAEISFKFDIGDYVRIASDKSIFEKGYTPNWSEDLYIIKNKYATNPPTYMVINLNGEKIDKTFYTEELQKVLFNEFPYDSFEVISEDKNRLKIRKINEKENLEFWIKKSELNDELFPNT